MIQSQTLNQLFMKHDWPKTDSDGVRYRIRQKDEETLEFSKLVPSSCSCSLYHPRMLVDISENEAVAISFYDNVSIPIVHVELADANETEEQFLDHRLEELISEFLSLI